MRALLRSFRVRIALWVTLLAGVVLLAFGAWVWTITQQVGLAQLDRDLRDLGLRQVAMPRPPGHWERLAESLETLYGGLPVGDVAFLVRDAGGTVRYASDGWPAGIAPESLPPHNALGPFAVPPPELFGPPGGPRGGPGGPDGPPGGPPRGPRRDFGRPQDFAPVAAPRFESRPVAGQAWRVATFANPDTAVTVAVPLSALQSQTARLRFTLLMGLPACLAAIAAGSFLLTGRALRPLAAVRAAAEGITAQGLDQRIRVAGLDPEFQRLVEVFNGVLARLERSFHQANRFSADAAHELKTPLAVLQGELERGIQETEPGGPVQQRFNTLLEQVTRLRSIIRKLLLLANADSGFLKLTLRAVDLSGMVGELCDDLEVLAPQLRIERQITENLWVSADGDLLRQALQNLADNAVKYNEDGGRIRVQLLAEAPYAVFRIANTGPAIAPEERERLFDRFYRGDKSRTGKADGAGLGLSLVREIAAAHGGSVSAGQTRAGMNLFELRLRGQGTGMAKKEN